MPKTDRHSKIVNGLKVGLPLAALALLSTLFLVADRIDTDAALIYAKVDIASLIQDPRMSAPTYAGITTDGTAISVNAESARPANDTRNASAEQVNAQLNMNDGSSAYIVAQLADIDNEKDELRLEGNVNIKTSSGYDVSMPEMVAALDRSYAQSDGPISGFAPAGTIDAGAFLLQQNEDETDPAAYVLVFSNRVKLIYDPKGR